MVSRNLSCKIRAAAHSTLPLASRFTYQLLAPTTTTTTINHNELLPYTAPTPHTPQPSKVSQLKEPPSSPRPSLTPLRIYRQPSTPQPSQPCPTNQSGTRAPAAMARVRGNGNALPSPSSLSTKPPFTPGSREPKAPPEPDKCPGADSMFREGGVFC